jgi:hypothetical protein
MQAGFSGWQAKNRLGWLEADFGTVQPPIFHGTQAGSRGVFAGLGAWILHRSRGLLRIEPHV